MISLSLSPKVTLDEFENINLTQSDYGMFYFSLTNLSFFSIFLIKLVSYIYVFKESKVKCDIYLETLDQTCERFYTDGRNRIPCVHYGDLVVEDI